jgi:hypothetical protein
MPDSSIPEEIRKEPPRAVVDDMMQETQRALQSSARAATELNELRRRADAVLDWKKQAHLGSWLGMGTAVTASILLFLAFRHKG